MSRCKHKKIKKKCWKQLAFFAAVILTAVFSIQGNGVSVIRIVYQNIIEALNPLYRIDLASLPEYEGVPYVEINGNIPDFTSKDSTMNTFETYSRLDFLGRCGAAYANLSRELMPDGERESIQSVTPTGWENNAYDIVENEYLYNRCHLIGFQLAGENANEKNLITGTRYMNVEGMLPFENEVAEYLKYSGNHVLYRVTPIFEETNLVASGVEMEAMSVEDNGAGICFHVYVYNVQPGIEIDYETGENWRAVKRLDCS